MFSNENWQDYQKVVNKSTWPSIPQLNTQPKEIPVISEEKINIYRSIANYFGDMKLFKGFDSPPDKLGKSYSFYYAKIGCLLCHETNYIVSITEQDMLPIGNIEKLSNLDWISFQTRTFENPPIKGLTAQSYKGTEDKNFLHDTVRLVKKEKGKWIYEPDVAPVKVELLDPDNDEVYSEKGTIKTCLDTFNCVISFVI
jgi:hypothetical protein